MNFEEIIIYLTTKQAVMVYAIIAISAFIENIFPPYPSDTIILAGAFLAGTGDLNYVMLFTFATIGGLAGAMVLYFFGYSKGRSFFERYDKSYFKLDNMEMIENWFVKWGSPVLIFSRFAAGVRSVIAIAAGIGKVPAGRMTFFSLISFCLWYGVLIGAMYMVKSNWQKLVEIIKSYNIILVVISAVVLTVWLMIVYSRNRTKK
ncbi:MAG: DedA family protein [candidate division Zixibacteria bacterium]|nr:DedA family protein [candidate division Zixibacteria bacterium]